ncbi:S-layer homology domain-containing protein [Pseudoflavonifractor sp. MSJ-37]|uniref:S-layer homology domain-containing protein n=1 Tax=Pseudoflavonifractor sp. MSJ-37 TaxID=2841531 RepID=UPI001C10C7A1|nr:S-layer homology domain-containing protein [Pseudoflavonifractor sp. MSJ-37]MBU5436071.1 S-layer homology domain-containing protein [Pseudoflavonifractor sp. MSJ-37]
MRHPLCRLAPLGLSLLLTVPALAAGMGAFVSKTTYTGFSDVSSAAWYAADVAKAVELGLMKGKGDGRFDPSGRLSAAEAVTMAAQVHAAYTGQTFTPGGSPWYRNAVKYATENGFLLRGEFSDYTAPVTRAEMAGLFAYALPVEELARKGRIPAVPDVSYATEQASPIWLLYGAGVLAGTGDGSFAPDTPIDRASAAAILDRLALPERRVEPSLTTPSAGTTVESPDKSFRLTFGTGDWREQTADGGTGLVFTDKSGRLEALSFPKSAAADLPAFSAVRLRALRDALGGVELLEQPGACLFRGLPAVSYRWQADGMVYTRFTVENSGTYVELTLSVPAGQDALYRQLLQTAGTFNLAL